MDQMMESKRVSVKKIALLDGVMRKGWFARRSEGFRAAVLSRAKSRNYDAGQYIYRCGDTANGLYGVVSGAVQITVPSDNRITMVGSSIPRLGSINSREKQE